MASACWASSQPSAAQLLRVRVPGVREGGLLPQRLDGPRVLAAAPCLSDNHGGNDLPLLWNRGSGGLHRVPRRRGLLHHARAPLCAECLAAGAVFRRASSSAFLFSNCDFGRYTSTAAAPCCRRWCLVEHLGGRGTPGAELGGSEYLITLSSPKVVAMRMRCLVPLILCSHCPLNFSHVYVLL